MNLQKKHNYIAVIAFASLTVPAFGADGDGSGSDNSDLLRDSLASDCYDVILCNPTTLTPKTKKTKITANNPATLKTIDLVPNNIPTSALNAALLNENVQNLPSSATVYDWSISLRGSFIKDHNGDRFEIIATPNISLSHKNRNANYNIGASASLFKQFEGDDYRFSGVNLDFNSDYILNREMRATLNANISIDQSSLNDPSLATTTALAPVSISGQIDASASRELGRFNAELRGAIRRNVNGTTKLVDNSWQDNSAMNNTGLEIGLRGSQELTPIVSAFVDASLNRNIYDNISSSLGATQSSTSYALRAGIMGSWRDTISAQASVGYGLTQYDSATLDDVPGTLFDVALGYKNGNGLNLNASFSNNISAADPSFGASTKLDYTTSLNASYLINEWLTARANVGAGWAHYVGIDDIERTISAGVGADYKFNRHTNLSADYSYGSLETTTLGKRENHKFELGVTFSR